MESDCFANFRKNIIGLEQTFLTANGDVKKMIYADWTASGRGYLPIEKVIQEKFLPFVANTHTDTNTSGSCMTYAYHKAQSLIKKHVNANQDDILISSHSGMTGVTNKLQRILGLRIHEKHQKQIQIAENDRPIIFITHMEHHSNHTSWLESIGDVEIIAPDNAGLPDLVHFQSLLEKYNTRTTKIAAVTSCSNVTGVFTPYYAIAKLIHSYNGFCFVDFACAAPYVDINMHPEDKDSYLDAIYFSPHKFLGGPGSSGILVFNKRLYANTIPDEPGGGTVDWTNPWGQHKYIDDIEAREDGGTPAFLQTIRVALCIQLKEEMGVQRMMEKEEVLLDIAWKKLSTIPNLHLLAPHQKKRLAILSFYIDDLHYNLGVKMLNDKFGIQARGGCSCAGTYGHYLLNVSEDISKDITDSISSGDNSKKPGWIRVSLHPTMTEEEVLYIANSIQTLAEQFPLWTNEYTFNRTKNVVLCKDTTEDTFVIDYINQCFSHSMS